MSGRLTLQTLLDEVGQPADNIAVDLTLSVEIAYRPLQGWFLQVDYEDEGPDEDLRQELARAEVALSAGRELAAAAADLASGSPLPEQRRALRAAIDKFEEVAG